ncbi:hypothetical protein [Corynebacterium callunae]|uniref:Uncharacterized protein n=1 Tax=Corynebacterium callunae DSM 20147 TaxID=1121353 RepID=M1UZ20_9CORY|nr:hypothetical protein [Corynebacterium callunae]AGG66903.1 hypothetical protein H924_07305 [Corynebacterium callunae DSM 20147]
MTITPLDMYRLRNKLTPMPEEMGYVVDTAQEVLTAFTFFTQHGLDTETATDLTAITIDHLPED